MPYEPIATRGGALSAQLLYDFMDAGFIRGAKGENVQPGSLDLSISEEVYRVEGVFQLARGERVRDLLGVVRSERHNLDEPLARDGLYLARLNEQLALPEDVYGLCNPKSTTGRLDVHVRVLADYVSRYDSIMPSGWRGELWVLIHAKSFWIQLGAGQTLSQLRLFNRDTRLSRLETHIELARHKLLWKNSHPIGADDASFGDNDGTLVLSLDLKAPVAGWRSVKQDRVVHLGKTGEYVPEDFFEPIDVRSGFAHLRRGEFYILSSLEGVRVPPSLACEMVSMDERAGDFRSHYAGFIDPGWGWGKEGEGAGRPLTLEVRPFEDIMARHGQPIARIGFEHMHSLPHFSYDMIASNYTMQSGPRLAKQFKAPQSPHTELLPGAVPSSFSR